MTSETRIKQQVRQEEEDKSENEKPAEGTEARASTPGGEGGGQEPPVLNTCLVERHSFGYKLRPFREIRKAVQDVLDARDRVPQMDGGISVMLLDSYYAPRLMLEM